MSKAKSKPKAARTNDAAAAGLGALSNALHTRDSFRNFLAHVGRGTGNQNDASGYGFNPITRVRQEMEWCYRGSWIAGRAVDCVAKDMTREGVAVHCDDAKPQQLQEYDEELLALQVWKKLCQTAQWNRLYGGACAFMMIDGQDPSTPLRIETIQKGQFKGLLPLDRWMLQPSLQQLVPDFGPDYGLPMFYDTIADMFGGVPNMRIHHSRIIRLEGIELPHFQRITENLWGQSVLERLWDRLVAYDSTTTGVAQLVYKAHLRTYAIEGLRDLIASNGPAMKAVAKQIEMMRVLQTNEGITLMDAKDQFEVHQYAFGGLDAVLIQMGEQLCGALEIPAVRLFGQSPAGFNSGDADLRNYHDSIKQAQVADLTIGVKKVYRLTWISKFGVDVPPGFELKWKPLWIMSDVEKTTAANTVTAAVTAAYDKQIVTRSTALKELKQSSRETGVWTHISDEEITAAESDPAPTPEALGLELPAKPDPGQPGGAPKPNANSAG